MHLKPRPQGRATFGVLRAGPTQRCRSAWSTPYQIRRIRSLPTWVDISDPSRAPHLAATILGIVESEGPIHLAVLDQRLRDSWDIGRIGARIRETIDIAIRMANVIREGDFLSIADQVPVVRTRIASCQRTVEQISDAELQAACLNLVSDARAISGDELTTVVSRLFGWSRRGPCHAAGADSPITRGSTGSRSV
jgi:hypothetical protein